MYITKKGKIADLNLQIYSSSNTGLSRYDELEAMLAVRARPRVPLGVGTGELMGEMMGDTGLDPTSDGGGKLLLLEAMLNPSSSCLLSARFSVSR